eukprot:CAMPEP_0201252048 /NCGR_PEP_ID=MMETSP0852-20130820/66701_1 /ASSEMBLY_ACC=CAM_ASM_000632 /TAXON_ID=183588 /ORGANISM="Pseudo-nitzschia fraudulenta, Strain WWA7" /LENGTH=350 /DNA_ID=CAMNT_0047551723 /DNA_START=58 /DNA_END=1111 /DNA_ORIENTATION=-
MPSSMPRFSTTATGRTTVPALGFVLLNLLLLSSLPRRAEAAADNIADNIFDASFRASVPKHFCNRQAVASASSRATTNVSKSPTGFEEPDRRKMQANAPTLHPWATALGYAPTPAPQQQIVGATGNSITITSPAMENFYIPVDATTCAEMEDPICPATACCPACEDELVMLYQCIIIMSDYTTHLENLAQSCPMDCKSPRNIEIGANPNVYTPPNNNNNNNNYGYTPPNNNNNNYYNYDINSQYTGSQNDQQAQDSVIGEVYFTTKPPNSSSSNNNNNIGSGNWYHGNANHNAQSYYATVPPVDNSNSNSNNGVVTSNPYRGSDITIISTNEGQQVIDHNAGTSTFYKDP